MSQIKIHINYTVTAMQDFARLSEFMETVSPHTKNKMIDTIQHGIGNLAQFPEIGKVAHITGMRELAIPFGKSGYSVLYRYRKDANSVDITAIKHYREQKYSIDM